MKYDKDNPLATEISMSIFRLKVVLALLTVVAAVGLPAAAVRAQQAGASAEEDAMVTMDFQDVDLAVLVKFISELTGKNFILDDTIKGKKVTVISPTKISKEEAYNVFESILDIKGFSTVPAGKVIKIVQTKDAVEQSIQTVGAGQRAPVSDTLITRLIPLEFVPADDLVNILKPLVSKESKIDAYPATNTIVLTDTASNIERLLKIIKQLDIQYDEMIMEVIPLEYASADVMAKHLQEVLQAAAATPSGGTPGQPPAPRPPPSMSRRGSAKKGEEFSGKIIADDRTNSLIVLATKSQLERIKDLVGRLDYDTPKAYGNINVYYLEYAKAEDTAKVLNELISGSKAGGGQKAGGAKEGAPPALAKTLESFEKEVSITSDAGTNSLIIVASPRDYQTLKNVIEKLDIRRNQVYVEAVIMEITPSFSLELGTEYRGAAPLQGGTDVDRAIIGGTQFDQGNAFVDKLTGLMNPGLASTSSIASSSTSALAGSTTTAAQSLNPLNLGQATGLTLGAVFDHVTVPVSGGKSVTLPANIFLMHATSSNSHANILSTPHMLAIDNEEAEIVVGQNVPFISSTSQSTISTMTSISRENVGITLRFTPQISESDYVMLKLYEEISSLIPSPIGQNANTVGPTTSTRKATNTALVKNGQTIVIGGLIEDRINKTKTKVPWLGDIPLLGWLFRYQKNSIDKTNLLIFLTPTIVKEDAEVQRIYQDKKKKIQEFKKRQRITDEGYDINPFEKEEPPAAKEGKMPQRYKVKVKGAHPVGPGDEQQGEEYEEHGE